MRMVKFFFFLVVLASIAGCAAPGPKYQWGSYSNDLYRYYAHSIKQEDFIVRLQALVQDAEANGRLVPPGIYAEYGYLLYEAGRYDEAIGSFRQEHNKWPESRSLMAKMIRNCEAKQNPSSKSTGEGADEK